MTTAYELMPYQLEGAEYLASRGIAGLFDEMGLGKTCQAIRALDLAGIQRALIIRPAAVHGVWTGEFRKFSKRRRRLIEARNSLDLATWLKGRADVMMVSYERAAMWQKHLEGEIIEAIILDESQAFKNQEAKRTKAILGGGAGGKGGIARWGLQTWFLSGTPMPNDPSDLWTFLHFSGATPLSFDAFTRRYFSKHLGTYSATYKPKPEMVPELRLCIKAVSKRRTLRQVGVEIPEIFITTQAVDGDSTEIRKMLSEYPGLEGAILDAIESGGLSFLDSQHIATLRRLIGEAKAPPYGAMLVDEMLRSSERRVVMGLHRRALGIIAEQLTRAGIRWCLVDGSVSGERRREITEEFQRGDYQVFLGNMDAAGVGITLTAACELDMFEQSWRPGVNDQAIKRIHRIGQERKCRARFISCLNTFDEVVAERVAEKTANIMAVNSS